MSTHIAHALIAAVVFSLSISASASASAADPGSATAVAKKTKERVVIQVSDSDPRTWNQALNVVNNLQSAYGKDALQVEVVAFGNGIGMLRFESEVGNRIQQAVASGAHVAACLNTMRARKLVRDDMQPGIGYVGSGVAELVEKQREGWVVIRP